ncbi:MAG: hypothetical protein KA436_02505 [Oligoflexales bacterium]|nr:hypothetical protein [Oligoflexales bacterium]
MKSSLSIRIIAAPFFSLLILSCRPVTTRKPIRSEQSLISQAAQSSLDSVKKSEGSLDSLRQMKTGKERDLKNLARELFADLDEFELSFKKCPAGTSPALTAADIQVFRNLGIERIEEALLQLNGPPAYLSTKKDEEKRTKDHRSSSWYSDQTNWGVFNMLASLAAIGGGIAFSSDVDIHLPDNELQEKYEAFHLKEPKASLADFRKYIEKDSTYTNQEKRISDLEEIDRMKVSTDKAKIGKTVVKYGAIAAGVGMFISGAIMTAAGQGALGLTEESACPANDTVRRQLFAFKDKVRDLKSEISLLNSQIDINEKSMTSQKK